MEGMAWIINIGTEDLEIIDMVSKKWVIMKPGRPQQVTRAFALMNIGRYADFRACDHPEKYFKPEDKLKHIIIRDGGIGDLLLLEPILRVLGKDRDITIKTQYPEMYKNHPQVKHVISLDQKHSQADYDCWDDLRNYSETSPNRNTTHRSQIYNEKFNVYVSDWEPRIYETDEDICPIDIKKGYKYFVIQCDASHIYRKYFRGEELAKYIIDQDEKNICVVLGGYNYVKFTEKHKRIKDLQGKTTIRQTIALIKEADYFIGGDSGLLHIACVLHTPALGMFSIITPDYRLRYYKGPYIGYKKPGLNCIGCGDFHMENCKFGNAKRDKTFIHPCMDIDPKDLYEAVTALPDAERVVYKSEKKEEVPRQVNIIQTTQKLTMPIIFQDEEENLPRFIELVMSHPAIGRVIAIDGGSSDNSAELLMKAGAEVYLHPYLKHYHDMQAMQRNISFSYVADNTNCIMMDIDEVCSKELADYLYFLAEQKEHRFGHIYRRTFNKFEDINDITKAIKDWPDPQPRFYVWDRKYKFVGGAHHQTLNVPDSWMIPYPILHYEAQNTEKRMRMESQWKGMMDGVRKYAGN